MSRVEYKIVTSTNGFKDLEAEVGKLLSEGWKPLGGIAFNLGYPFQAVAKVTKTATTKPRTANEAMNAIDSLT